MPYQPFSMGNALAQAESIVGQRNRNALAQQQLDPNSMQNQLRAAQIQKLQYDAQNPGGNRVSPVSFKDATGDSIAEYQRTGDPGVLVRHYTPYKPWSIDTKTHRQFWDINVETREPELIKEVPIQNFRAEYDKTMGGQFAEQGGAVPEISLTGGDSPDVGLGGGPIKVKSKAELAADSAAAVAQAETKEAVQKRYLIDDADTVIAAQNQLGVMQTENRNLDKVIKLSDNGANTGPIMKYLPTLTSQSVKMENLQRRMGLDIIGAVTFGALSKGELDLALNTAIPTNLDGPELVKWARDKQAANNKLSSYLMEQVKFIRGGGTKADWLDRVQNAGGINPAIESIESGGDFSTMSDEQLQAIANQ